MTTNHTVRRDARESGNVLFLILIAVALFAALSYAVTQSSRSGGNESTGEKSIISGAQVTQYPAGVRTSIVRMLIDNNTAIEHLEFNSPSDFANLTQISNKYVYGVFHPDGGGATYQNAPADIMDSGTVGVWYFNAEFHVPLIGTSNASVESNELTAFLPGVKSIVCVKVDDQLGIPSSPIPVVAINAANFRVTQGAGTGYQAYPTSYTAGNTITTGGSPDALSGQPFGCFATNDATPVYIYYHVLLER